MTTPTVADLVAVDVPFSSVVGKCIMLAEPDGAAVAQISITVPNVRYPYRETVEAVAHRILAALSPAAMEPEPCYWCSNTGLTLNHSGDPTECPRCGGDTVISSPVTAEAEARHRDEILAALTPAPQTSAATPTAQEAVAVWKSVERKFYRSEWPLAKLLEARNGGLVTDEGEAWVYRYTHKDGVGGEYDMLVRRELVSHPPQPSETVAEAAVEAAFKALPPDAHGTIGSGEMERVLEAACRAQLGAPVNDALKRLVSVLDQHEGKGPLPDTDLMFCWMAAQDVRAALRALAGEKRDD